MTTAVCIKCGSLKLGAALPCKQCGSQPKTEDELIWSVWMSDHHFSLPDLERAGAEVAAGRPPRLDDHTKGELRAALAKAQKLAPNFSAVMGLEPESAPAGRESGFPSFEAAKAANKAHFQSEAMGRITPEEWAKASGDPEALTKLLVERNEEIKAERRGTPEPTEQSPTGGRRGWWAIALALGAVAGAAAAYLLQLPYAAWAHSGYSGQSHLMFFSTMPSESEILDEVIQRDPWNHRAKDWDGPWNEFAVRRPADGSANQSYRIDRVARGEVLTGGALDHRTSELWKEARSEGKRLYIMLDKNRSVLVMPYSPNDDPDPGLEGVKGVWLTEPSTRTLFPPTIVRSVFFLLGLVSTVAAVFIARLVWYFLLVRLRELSRAIRGA